MYVDQEEVQAQSPPRQPATEDPQESPELNDEANDMISNVDKQEPPNIKVEGETSREALAQEPLAQPAQEPPAQPSQEPPEQPAQEPPNLLMEAEQIAENYKAGYT
jgi:hypothetical protein